MAKSLKAYRLTPEVVELLAKLCVKHNRPSATNMIETLIIEEAKRLKIK